MSIRSYRSFLLKFWYRPVSSMRQLLDLQQGHSLALVVAALFGMVHFSRLFAGTFEISMRYFAFHGLAGIVCLFLFGWLIRNLSRWFSVEAKQREVRTALGLGILPWTILFAILLLMLNLGLDPEFIVTKYFPVFLGAFVYGFCILLLSLTAALRLSVIKTFLCTVVTILFILFPLTLLAQVLVNYLK